MFLKYSYFLAKSEADVLINSVLLKRKACTFGSKGNVASLGDLQRTALQLIVNHQDKIATK